jgi:hypothetical protein
MIFAAKRKRGTANIKKLSTPETIFWGIAIYGMVPSAIINDIDATNKENATGIPAK